MRLSIYFILLCLIFTQIKLSLSADSFVTCGSLIKLLNYGHNVRLHSHEVKYGGGSGSGQQTVTAISAMDDVNSYWILRAPHDKQCIRGSRLSCGEKVVLQHSATKLFLHSHYFTSPLSHNQEVSCFGENSEGDNGDYWILECSGKFWKKKDKIRLKHALTEMYLHVPGDTYGRPIAGQKEVCGYAKKQKDNQWSVEEGVMITYDEESEFHIHDDL
ncbi:hypothetical protein LOD99_3298 [Oopsacas minuta]|uniref:MIR domain-containing protein n=1 Tax=Oopsacas minuta TaxID=111878 RepID=A0AAV7JZK5_9METZ|nr:hypothetical protein LOD99_3298 [Oopsacas minuta]